MRKYTNLGKNASYMDELEKLEELEKRQHGSEEGVVIEGGEDELVVLNDDGIRLMCPERGFETRRFGFQVLMVYLCVLFGVIGLVSLIVIAIVRIPSVVVSDGVRVLGIVGGILAAVVLGLSVLGLGIWAAVSAYVDDREENSGDQGRDVVQHRFLPSRVSDLEYETERDSRWCGFCILSMMVLWPCGAIAVALASLTKFDFRYSVFVSIAWALVICLELVVLIGGLKFMTCNCQYGLECQECEVGWILGAFCRQQLLLRTFACVCVLPGSIILCLYADQVIRPHFAVVMIPINLFLVAVIISLIVCVLAECCRTCGCEGCFPDERDGLPGVTIGLFLSAAPSLLCVTASVILLTLQASSVVVMGSGVTLIPMIVSVVWILVVFSIWFPSAVYSIRRRQRLSRFEQLENFDILLMEGG